MNRRMMVWCDDVGARKRRESIKVRVRGQGADVQTQKGETIGLTPKVWPISAELRNDLVGFWRVSQSDKQICHVGKGTMLFVKPRPRYFLS